MTISYDDLSTDQERVYQQISRWMGARDAQQCLTLGGLAGTGKTTLISVLAVECQNAGRKVAFCAYTGKAVSVLRRKLKDAGVDAYCNTIHGLIYYPEVDAKGRIIGWTLRPGPNDAWRNSNTPSPLAGVDLIIMDEASMVDGEIWNDLMSYGIPILAVGDHGQLPPVSRDALNLMEDPDLRLEQIHRQAADNPILTLAHAVRQGDDIYRFKSPDDRVTFAKSMPSSILDVYRSDRPLDAAVICYRNSWRVKINDLIRSKLGRTGAPTTDDVVICLRNDKPLFNGLRGVIADPSPDDDLDDVEPMNTLKTRMRLDFPDDDFTTTRGVCRAQFGREKTFTHPNEAGGASWGQIGQLFDYGYALTCHKAQGSQFREVAVGLFDLRTVYRCDEETRRRWLYSACTRATDRLVIVG